MGVSPGWPLLRTGSREARKPGWGGVEVRTHPGTASGGRFGAPGRGGYRGATAQEIGRRSGFLLLVMLLFVLGSLAVGILISTLARTQVQAVFGTYAYAFPTIFPSGFVFPVDGIPRFFQLLSYLVPARYLIEGLRGVMLKGVGWAVLWPHLLALPCFSTLVLFLASVRFQRQGGRL